MTAVAACDQEVTFVVHDDVAVGLDGLDVVFDDERVVSDAGIVLVATLAERLGIEDLARDLVRLRRDRAGAANAGRKVMALVFAMLLGANSIDDCDVLRAGRTRYTKVLGYHPILATRADTREVLHIRLRKGSANTQKGMLRFTDELIARVDRANATGVKLLRADSGFWSTKVFRRLEQAGWEYSIGVRMIKQIKEIVDQVPRLRGRRSPAPPRTAKRRSPRPPAANAG